MSDSRLNSIHLPAPRREQFRLVRAALLGTTGDATIAGSLPPNASYAAPDRTSYEDGNQGDRVRSTYVLVDNNHVHQLKVGINTVGRMPDNDVVVADPYVSRRHVAIVVHSNGGCELHDVASKNGTLINGRTLSGPTPLHAGDQIRLSDHLLIFRSEDDRPRPPDVEKTRIE
jgi:hypothetical protein